LAPSILYYRLNLYYPSILLILLDPLNPLNLLILCYRSIQLNLLDQLIQHQSAQLNRYYLLNPSRLYWLPNPEHPLARVNQ
jgi:hypothetical protein